MDSLIGKVVTELAINEEYSVLRVRTDEKTHYFMTSGDCCNDVYWNDISGVANLLGQQVLNLVHHAATEREGGSNGFLEDYMVTLETSKGRCDFIYRNDHNGYYGGHCDKVESQRLVYSGRDRAVVEDLKYFVISEDYGI